MDIKVDFEKGFVNKGNTAKVKRVLCKAAAGEPITVAFLGGSITQGCLATKHELCYAKLTHEWFVKKYPTSQVTYVNAGIGGTTSHFGVSRVDADVLSKKPDLVFVEFSVNDEADFSVERKTFFKETYEGLVRHILSAENEPAVFLIHNIFYDSGRSAEDYHREIGAHYSLPSVSMRPTVYELVKQGVITSKDVTEDHLHPNDCGHALLSGLICHALEVIDSRKEDGEEALPKELPTPLTMNTYECTERFQQNDMEISLEGFVKDTREKTEYLDIFSKGWEAKQVGDKMSFIVKGSGIALQYRKTPRKPAPVAEVIVDGDTAHPVILDANFDEDWGDLLEITPLLVHGEEKEHTVSVRIVKATPEDDISSFYLVSVLVNH